MSAPQVIKVGMSLALLIGSSSCSTSSQTKNIPRYAQNTMGVLTGNLTLIRSAGNSRQTKLEVLSPTPTICEDYSTKRFIEIRGPLPSRKIWSIWELSPEGKTEVIAQVELGKFEINMIDQRSQFIESKQIEITDIQDRFSLVFKNCQKN